MASSDTEFDIIFAGGGTAACITAGRLAAADPSLKILILEAGPHTLDDNAHIQPARYISHLLPDSKTVKFMVGKESKYLGGRAPIVPCGQCIGGGSSVNFTMYTRASASDYDDWETVYGNKGWASKDLIPLLQKTETYQIEPSKETHGTSGPLKVSYGGIFPNVGKDFLTAAAAYDKQSEFTDDPNGLFSCNKYSRWPKWISADSGKRSDAAHHFLYTQKDNKNLKVQSGCLVKRVIFEGKRAVGVEYVYNTRFHPNESPTKVYTVSAKRLVVVSAGACGSPLILERSGVGAKSLLERLGINTIVDLPGVGENYQDHQVMFTPYLASEESDTLDGIVRSEKNEIDKWGAQWLQDGSGLMANNGLDAGIKLRPTGDELKAIGPEFETRWKEYFANALDKPIFWMGPIAMLVGDQTIVPLRKYFCMAYFLTYPSSTGHLHIASGDDVNAPSDFDPGFLKEVDDLAVLRWAYKRTREMARRMDCYRGDFAPKHPAFPKGSVATCEEASGPVAADAPDLVYTAEDDKAIDDNVRDWVATTWHSLGTCSMKPREKGGVVDSRLNVYGLEGLKVSDMSIAPGNVGSNTYSTATAIAEKTALIIAEELGIKGV